MDENGNPSELYVKNRLAFYLDPVPHRHKYVGTETNKNIPKFFVWRDKEGKEHRLTYVESRQFYCNFYERLAPLQDDFKKLVQMLDNGTNLQIIGYDAFPLTGTLEEAYLDPSKPFGHELCLYALLTAKPEEYPWRKYKTFDF